MLALPRDLLRRHSVVHEASHTRVVISCDVCRANKTKCSGGIPCSLCSRRGINCTFRSNIRRSKRASTGDGSTAVNASLSGNGEPVLPPSSRPENIMADNPLRIEGERLLPNEQFFLNLPIVPSKPVPASESQPLSPGMEAIYELVVAEKSSLEGAIEKSDELQEWVTKSLESYFKTFHHRWPIVHAPTFDIGTVPLSLAASVCVIGVWLQNSGKWAERFYALRVHESLLGRLIRDMVRILYPPLEGIPLIFSRLTPN